MARGNKNPDVRLAQPGDLERIAQFLIPLGGESFAERFPDATAQDFYHWKYFRNPLGVAIVAIATDDASVVSVVAATPKHIQISGKVFLAYELGDFLTDENYRKLGLFSRLIELVCGEAASRGAAMVYVRPNDVSFRILVSKLSFHEARRLEARRFVIPSHTLARKMRIPASIIRLSGIDWLLKKRRIPRYRGSVITVTRVERFGEETNRLWKRASGGYDFALVRDSGYLNWRFCDCPTPYTIWLASRNGEAAGFLVTSTDHLSHSAAVVDLFAESGDADAVRALLATGVENLLSSGARMISTWTPQAPARSAAHKLLQHAFPFRRKQHLHLAFRVLNPAEITLPSASQTWHFTLGDSDGA